ncbi:MAG TPA: molybdate ABC transporter permease subunit [Clostridia bacterium]|nr:molybdate ABC transporter permease subunit [Clostridia bacterium]
MELDLSPLWISLRTATTATLITILVGVALASWMVFSRAGSKALERCKALIDLLVILPMVLPPTVLGFILLLIFGKNGVIGRFLHQLGMTIVFSWPATVITATVVALPLMYRTTRAAFEQIQPEIIDAARVLGVPDWYTFFRVVLPVSLPSIGAGIILSFARALGEFGATIMLAGNIPGKTQTIPLAIFLAVESGRMEAAYFWVAIVLVISISAILGMNYWTRKQYRFKVD